MSQRILRTVPAALLMTTALAWNLPAAAQGTMGAPVGAATGTVQKAPAPATPAPAADTAPRGGAAAKLGEVCGGPVDAAQRLGMN